jgi:tyrosyl-tRNA synthetase
MYGKLMSISDELMWKYWTLLTDLRGSEIARMQEEVREGALHPMQAKKNLAWTITRDFHSQEEADAAAESWAKMFQQRGMSEDVPVVEISLRAEGLAVAGTDSGSGSEVRMAKLLQLAGLASSTGEATRKLAENAVSVDGEKFNGRALSNVRASDSTTLRLGKKSVRVKWMS